MPKRPVVKRTVITPPPPPTPTPRCGGARDGRPAAAPIGPSKVREMLERLAKGELTPAQVEELLRTQLFEDMGFAKLDHHRKLRRGFPEVVFCSGKTTEQVALIVERFAAVSGHVLGTRASREQYEAARRRVPGLLYHDLGRVLWLDPEPERKHDGVAVVAAGTSDLPVAEEAAITLEVLGHRPQRIYDVGVAGLHRLLHHLPALAKARAVVVVAGMEGALPSVVGGLIPAPIIAVPTSVGYGASFGGIAALLGMLNSCSPGVAVVNIDNGFGGGYLAATINHGCVVAAGGKEHGNETK